MLHGIDISAYQPDIDPAKLTTTDFVIVKATQGTGYTSASFTKQVNAALNAGKLVGVYHYADGSGYAGEASHFISVIKPYIGKVVIALDWETGASSAAKNAAFNNVSYAKAFLDYVKAKTGVVPIIYMSESVAASKDWSSVAASYKLWGAQYANYNTMNYTQSPWSSGGWGAWGSKPLIHQYSSSGRITGYSGNLDINLFYGTKSDWAAMCASGNSPATATATTAATSDSSSLQTFYPWKAYKNGSTEEPVYKNVNRTTKTGSLNAYESCYCMAKYKDSYLVCYKIDGSDDNWAVGYVAYNGGLSV